MGIGRASAFLFVVCAATRSWPAPAEADRGADAHAAPAAELRADRPQLVLGVDGGAARFARIDGATDLGFGPLVELRVGAQLFPWVALGARCAVTRHTNRGSLVSHAEVFEARLSLPLALRPHLALGFGRYDVTAYDSDGNQRVAPDAAAAIPASIGVEKLLTSTLGIQLEGTYWLLFQNDEPSKRVALASLWGATVGGRAYF